MAEETNAKMGSVGKINITVEMMTSAISAIDTYLESVKTEYTNISNAITGLGIGTSFKGSAANGFKTFYDNNIDPMLKKDGGLEKMLTSLRDICESARKQIPGEAGVDDELAKINNQGNQNA